MKQQILKATTQTGSLMNHIMSGNSTTPKVGEGCTVLCWTDRHAYTVTFVSEDGLTCKIRRYNAVRTDYLSMSDSQQYDYQEVETNPEIELVYRNGSWRMVSYEIRLTKEWADKTFSEKAAAGVWGPDATESWPVLVEGVTKKHRKTDKVSVIFGRREEYYDYSF